jgi:hypothetical protein
MGGGGNQSGWANAQRQTGGQALGGWGNAQAQAGGPTLGALGGWGPPQAAQSNDPIMQGQQRPFSDVPMPQRRFLNNLPVDYLRALRMGAQTPGPNQIDTTDFMARYPQFRAANGGNVSVQ